MPNSRSYNLVLPLEALLTISDTPLLSSWFHAKVCIVAGVGFFTDASVHSPACLLFYQLSQLKFLCFSYDIFAINVASIMLGYVYGVGGKLNTNQDLGVKVATPVGTLVGQLLFGWLADVVGRKKMCK